MARVGRSSISLALGLVFLLVCIAAPRAYAQPDDGGLFDWCEVGAPGNAPYTGTPVGRNPELFIGRGRVDTTFRISRTELTTRQWVAFSNAISRGPAYNALNARLNNRLFTNTLPPGVVSPSLGEPFTIAPGRWADVPAQMSWREAAIFCNWLHNGRPASLDDCLTGAYDTSTWDNIPRGITDGAARLPGARFFIPNLDEIIKAAYYDPHRYGPGQEGYWRTSRSTDADAIPFVDGTGAGVTFNHPTVGSFPHARSPWGLLDVYGGHSEVIEDYLIPNVSRYTISGGLANDALLNWGANDVWTSAAALTTVRIASIPSPSLLWCLPLFGAHRLSRRSRSCV